jgi:nitrate reductase alpha subunit
MVPNGSLGFRFGEQGTGQWNLDLGDVDPLLTVLDSGSGETSTVTMPRAQTRQGRSAR